MSWEEREIKSEREKEGSEKQRHDEEEIKLKTKVEGVRGIAIELKEWGHF